MQLDKFRISALAPIREALKLIEANQHGIIFATDPSGVVSAMATDGDIRRHLMLGGSIEDAVDRCANTNFVWEHESTPREVLLKTLSNRIRVIPLLDDARRLV